ncbi:MAG: IS481 family transposase [Bacteroidetes bacterium]|nr:MAG: IS481 family transposase [Bacteroidota bacterium]
MKKTKEIEKYLAYRKKLRVLKLAKDLKSNRKAYEIFDISKSTFYSWKKKFDKYGEQGLVRKKREPESFANRIDPNTVNLILKLREEHKLGTWRIKWYLERYHDIAVSESSVYRTLKRNNIKALDRTTTRLAMATKRYEKSTPGHHVQVDVKFLIFEGPSGQKIKRFQYTAIDDSKRIRAIKVYERHNQVSSIDFINHIVEKFPFRINTVQTDNGHEFQSKFHWHVQDCGMRHRYIKPGKPQHNGKVERSHLTDKREFYQLLDYTDDVDLRKKLSAWEQFYNFNRPHGAFKGMTPYETLKCKLKN